MADTVDKISQWLEEEESKGLICSRCRTQLLANVPEWRYSGENWEHKCPDLRAFGNVGHFVARPWKTMPLLISLDFDGVVHSHKTNGNGNNKVIHEPVEGAFDWIRSMIDDSEFDLCIFSCRNTAPGGVTAMIDWFHKHGMEDRYLMRLSFPLTKPFAVLFIDDRGWNFAGTFPSKEFIKNFIPWNRDE